MRSGSSGGGSKLGRRGFLGASLGMGAAAPLLGRAEGKVVETRAVERGGPDDLASGGDVETILAKTEWMDLLGSPRTWAVVRDGFHPFAPERIVVWPSGNALAFDHCERGRRRDIDRKVDELWTDSRSQGHPLPDEKRESIYRIIDRWVGHYHRPDLFEPWVLGLAGRESLASTALGGHVAFAHQFNGKALDVPVRLDCPPVDWWLFLSPEGIDWASLGEEPTHAILGHVGPSPYHQYGGFMLRVWCLGSDLIRHVEDWREVSRMGRVDASRHLNRVVASILREGRR